MEELNHTIAKTNNFSERYQHLLQENAGLRLRVRAVESFNHFLNELLTEETERHKLLGKELDSLLLSNEHMKKMYENTLRGMRSKFEDFHNDSQLISERINELSEYLAQSQQSEKQFLHKLKQLVKQEIKLNQETQTQKIVIRQLTMKLTKIERTTQVSNVSNEKIRITEIKRDTSSAKVVKPEKKVAINSWVALPVF